MKCPHLKEYFDNHPIITHPTKEAIYKLYFLLAPAIVHALPSLQKQISPNGMSIADYLSSIWLSASLHVINNNPTITSQLASLLEENSIYDHGYMIHSIKKDKYTETIIHNLEKKTQGTIYALFLMRFGVRDAILFTRGYGDVYQTLYKQKYKAEPSNEQIMK